jgi:lysophospholipase L1-like esterase
MRPAHAAGACTLAIVLGATACSPQPGVPRASPAPAPFVLTVIGDSIPFNAPDDCSGCTGFVDTVADALRSALDRDVVVRNASRHDGARTHDIVDQLIDDRAIISSLPDADVVLVSFGFNDQPPYWFGGPPCQTVNETDDEAAWVNAIATTTTECIDSTTATLRTQARTALTRLRELAPDAGIGVLNSYNAWIGWAGETRYPDAADNVAEQTAYALDTWSSSLCAEAQRIDATCVDIYHAFNGADGMDPAGALLADDYTHPSQQGNDLIARVLLDSGLWPETG